jgi:anti-sigma factor (TIGR02949 family)
MKCRDIQEKLSAYIDKELNPDRFENVTQHLIHCPECRSELEALQKADRVLKNVPFYNVPAKLTERLLQEIHITSSSTENLNFINLIFAPMTKFFLNFFTLVESLKSFKTATLDEFSDFPPCSMGYIYFNLIDQRK